MTELILQKQKITLEDLICGQMARENKAESLAEQVKKMLEESRLDFLFVLDIPPWVTFPVSTTAAAQIVFFHEHESMAHRTTVLRCEQQISGVFRWLFETYKGKICSGDLQETNWFFSSSLDPQTTLAEMSRILVGLETEYRRVMSCK